MRIIQDWLYLFGKYVDDYETIEGRIVSNSLYALNIIFIGVYILSTYPSFDNYSSIIHIIEFCIALVFVVEVLSRLIFADSVFEELTSPYTIFDILAIAPVLFYPLSVGTGLEFFRVFYSLRAIRFLRLSLSRNRFFGIKLSYEKIARIRIALTIFLIFFITAGAFYEVEHLTNPNIANFGDALYYSIVAISTAGFGDITPTTTLGRFITMFGLLIAITLIPLQVARARQPPTTELEVECEVCGLTDHAYDARYCKRCGKKIIDGDSVEESVVN